jgi:hypothetical protein
VVEVVESIRLTEAATGIRQRQNTFAADSIFVEPDSPISRKGFLKNRLVDHEIIVYFY